jgi:hypothetical protein
MGVPIGHAEIAVAEYLRKLLEINPIHTSEARIGVSQIVQAEVGDARALASADECNGDLGWLDIREEQTASFERAIAHRNQDKQSSFIDKRWALFTVFGVPEPNFASGHVNVFPSCEQ